MLSEAKKKQQQDSQTRKSSSNKTTRSEPKKAYGSWEMSAQDALCVNYLVREFQSTRE